MVFYIENQNTTVDILDTAGQDEFSAMQDQWMREGDGFLLVYSITSSTSFNDVKAMYEKIKRTKPGKIPVYVSHLPYLLYTHI
jgi:GTPase KRas protein